MLQFGALVNGGHRLSQKITIEPANIEVSEPLERRKHKDLMPSGMEVDIMRDGRDVVISVYSSFPKSSSSRPYDIPYFSVLKFRQRNKLRRNGNLLGGVLNWNLSTNDSVELWMLTIMVVCPTTVSPLLVKSICADDETHPVLERLLTKRRMLWLS